MIHNSLVPPSSVHKGPTSALAQHLVTPEVEYGISAHYILLPSKTCVFVELIISVCNSIKDYTGYVHLKGFTHPPLIATLAG